MLKILLPFLVLIEIFLLFAFIFSKIFSISSYKGELLDRNVLSQTVSDDKVNAQFRNLVSWISNEIGCLGNLDERVCLSAFINLIYFSC